MREGNYEVELLLNGGEQSKVSNHWAQPPSPPVKIAAIMHRLKQERESLLRQMVPA